jgi:D-alanyl-D-alanine carboxypeptidase
MSCRTSARPTGRRTRFTILATALFVVSAALAGVLGYPTSASPSTATSAQPTTLPGHDRPLRGHPGEADAGVPDGTTVFDTNIPAVAKLDPDLLRALRAAAADARRNRVELDVSSGWRSRAYQQQLFREAVSRYGSTAEAARWVAPPGKSAHESGDAVDLGGSGTTAWLATHGSRCGLCQIYGNEPWHYELRPAAVDRGCPAMYADASQDPRTH